MLSKRVRLARLACAALAGTLACGRPLSYGPAGPRYAGPPEPPRHAPRCVPAQLRVVSFNVKYAQHVDRAIALFDSTPALRGADIIALQEMDAAATRRFAGALGLWYVYYPASTRPVSKQDFGNAILSRWPIVADRKILLPHLGRILAARRAAVAATIDVGGLAVRIYSVHLATQLEIGTEGRRDQALAVVADAETHPRVVVAGDMNSYGIGETFVAAGFAWPTRDQPVTTAFFNWDHIFLRGLALTSPDSSGVVEDNRFASDHRPVWAVLATPAPGASAAPPGAGHRGEERANGCGEVGAGRRRWPAVAYPRPRADPARVADGT
jgi:endonuclease/exonuclease/phosphatase family metal-dependent hydrolase